MLNHRETETAMPNFAPHITPHRTYRWGIRTVAVAAPLALATLVAWGFNLSAHLAARPQLVMMLYVLFLLVAAAGFCTAMLAGCHLAVSKAFGAGYSTGAQYTASAVATRTRQRAHLRAVGDDNHTA